MILKRKLSLSGLATSLALLLTISSLQGLAAKELAHNRYNLFDPMFAYDDVDAHYVSPSHADSSSSSLKPSTGSGSTSGVSGEQQLRMLLQPDATGAGLAEPVSVTPRRDEPALVSKTTPQFIGSSTPTRSTSTYLLASSFLPDGYVEKVRKVETTEPPRYWSGLENLYHNQMRMQRVPAIQVPQYPIYQLPLEVDESLEGYKKPGYSIINMDPSQRGTANQNPAFWLPIMDAVKRPKQQQQQQPMGQIEYAPSISRLGGIGADGFVMSPEYSQQVVQPDQAMYPSHTGTRISYSQVAPIGGNSPAAMVGEDGKLKYLEWRKLPDLLMHQQQQQRIQHQQDTFGPWFDSQRTLELLQEEAYCSANHLSFLAGQSGKDLDKNYYLSRLLAAAAAPSEAARQQPVASEYPSHMGLYNGSVEDDNYLCAATWIDVQFALTLASCVVNQDPRKLMFRAGEWNLGRNKTNDDGGLPMITGHVDRVQVFPRYRNDSVEHNLALLRFSRPVDMFAAPYIKPACQMQSRNSLQTSSCWAPTRNVSLVEYFDPSGEGESKERKSVTMTELPVRLMANNELDCQRETKVELFNFQHPNYICSGDFRKSLQRMRLNNSETFGAGIYCHEGGYLSLVSIVHPISMNSSSAIGYMDLSYYRPWMRNVMASLRL